MKRDVVLGNIGHERGNRAAMLENTLLIYDSKFGTSSRKSVVDV